MSHQAELEIQIHDLECLKKACQDVGAELKLDQHEYKTWQGHEKCDYAITVPGKTAKMHEIGVLRISTEPETYQLRTDFFAGGYGLEAVVGQDACKLNQAYQAAVFEKAIPFGWEVSRTVMQNGEMIVEAEMLA